MLIDRRVRDLQRQSRSRAAERQCHTSFPSAALTAVTAAVKNTSLSTRRFTFITTQQLYQLINPASQQMSPGNEQPCLLAVTG